MALDEAEEQAEGEGLKEDPLAWAEQAQFVLACRVEFEGEPRSSGPALADCNTAGSLRARCHAAAAQSFVIFLKAAAQRAASFLARCLASFLGAGGACKCRARRLGADCLARTHACLLPCSWRTEERDQLAAAMDVSLQEEQQRKQAQLPLHERPDEEIWQASAEAGRRCLVAPHACSVPGSAPCSVFCKEGAAGSCSVPQWARYHWCAAAAPTPPPTHATAMPPTHAAGVC